MRRIVVAALILAAVGLLLLGLVALHSLVAGPFHPPTDGGYWGGIFLHRLWQSS